MNLKKLLFNIFAFILSSLIFIHYSNQVHAADYRSDYQVEYFLSENNQFLNTNVRFSIKITNLRSDVYVNKFSLSFPKSFAISNLKAFDDRLEITPSLAVDDTKTKIDLEFSRPNTGKESVNTFTLEFNQENLFEINGNVWEVILPTIENREEGNYKIIVNLPQNTDKKISISKPKPTSISGNQIIWENPSTRTVYAVFGEFQLYALNLNYHLKNPNIYPVYTDVAFPPDTLYQKIFIESIKPKPSSTYTDEDGNFLGRYFLKPNESLPIAFVGTAEIRVKPREEIIPVIRSSFLNQKKYLLSEKKYWEGVDSVLYDRTPDAIYNYVVNTLQYDYGGTTRKNNRLGAVGALQQPNRAVCVEFSDLFISIAREKGIYSREIQGYGFSKDPQLRPLSLLSDVLHSWPEFYDKGSQIWIQADPTWENTSGIDYFNSFDLNHIAFVIHGKRSDYPLPAGMYKTENSRDVSVTVTTVLPKENKDIDLVADNLPEKITDKASTKTKITILNKGNVFLWNIPISIKSEVLNIKNFNSSISLLAPFEKKEISFEIASKLENKKINATLDVYVSGNKELSKQIIIIPYTYELALKISSFVAFLLLLILLTRIFRSSRKRS